MDPRMMLAEFIALQNHCRPADVKFIISAEDSKAGDFKSAVKPTSRKSKKSTKPKPEPKYKRLDGDDRVKIEVLHRKGFSQAEIADEIGCSRSTISRELKNNRSNKGYRAKKADKISKWRVQNKATNRKKMTDSLWAGLKEKLELGWTPAMISEHARKNGKSTVCKELIYQEYYRRQKLVIEGVSDESLPLLPKRRKLRKTRDRNAKKYTKDAGRGKIKGRVDISERPESVNNRCRVGHWEGDLINGANGTGHIVTLVERMTRRTLWCYVPTKRTEDVMSAILRMLGSIPRDMLQTLTFDNGKEFAGFKLLELVLGLKVFFARPYHSWERGTNENRNGIVRMVLPKGRAFDAILAEEMKRIDYLLNDRPMECLNWRTPREAFSLLLKRHSTAA